MNAAKEIQAAEALSTKAAQKELGNDLNAAFELHVKAAQTFLHLARTLPDAHAKSCRAAAGRSLNRAELIKQAKRDVRPVAADPYSSQEQAYILDKSALVNGRKYPSWQDADGKVPSSSEPFRDPDGQPELPSAQLDEPSWRRPTTVFPPPQRMTDAALLPEHVVQNLVTDCSVVASIVVCLGHQQRFGSKLGLSSIYPQDEDGLPMVSNNGMYAIRVFMNGSWRKLVVDDSLPFLTDGKLLGVCTTNNVLWPPMLEKAYMKLMGGYDFPGSNSCTDLHALVGWIPEHIHLRGAGFKMESTWTRIFRGFSAGHCLLTLGSPASSSNPLLDDLIPAHNYAVMDMHDDGSEQTMTLLDPWHDRGEKESDKSWSASPFRRLTWREACNRFDTVHMSWDPSQFSRQLLVHGLWKPHTSISKHSNSVSRTLRVFIKGAKSWEEKVWVLLTRHIVGKHKASDFISLNVALDDIRSTSSSDKLSLQDTYSDSVHVLQHISPGTRDSMATIIASIDKTDTEVGYTVSIFSPMEVTVDTRPPQGFHSKTVEGTLTPRNSGGNFTHPTYMNNPQYRLHLRSESGARSGSDNATMTVRYSVEGPRDLPLNLKIVWSNGQRITEVVEGDVVSDTGAYSYGMAFGEKALKVGEYTVIVSSFEPRQHGPFELSLHSLRAFDLEAIPAEGAGMFSKVIRGAWDRESSAGAPSFGRYNSNPIIEVSIPTMAQLIIRLQLLTPSSPVALNITLFKMNPSGGLGQQVLTSGPYSDAVAGALIPRTAVAPGKYLLVPSTYTSNIEADFQVLLYSTASGIELSLHSV